LLRPGGDALQVVVGPIADTVAAEIRAAAREPSAAADTPPRVDDVPSAPADVLNALAPVFGGVKNVAWSALRDNRLMVELHDPALLRADLAPAMVRALASPSVGVVHLLLRRGQSRVFTSG
jgi:PTS system N-acetylglucosamine-specific IIC component